MKTLLALLSFLLLNACCSTCPVTYEETSFEEDMALMMEYSALGPEHETLASMVGTWDVAATWYMGPGAEGMPMMATSTMTLAMDGRQLVENFRSDFQGEPFNGRLLMGYDNLADRLWTIWTDNVSTDYGLSHGQFTDDGGLEMHGTMRDHKTPDGRPTRTEMSGIGSDRMLFSMYDTGPSGELYLVMEAVYERRG